MDMNWNNWLKGINPESAFVIIIMILSNVWVISSYTTTFQNNLSNTTQIAITNQKNIESVLGQIQQIKLSNITNQTNRQDKFDQRYVSQKEYSLLRDQIRDMNGKIDFLYRRFGGSKQ